MYEPNRVLHFYPVEVIVNMAAIMDCKTEFSRPLSFVYLFVFFVTILLFVLGPV
jgi:hypothetical protein